MSDLFELSLNALVSRQLEDDPSFQQAEKAAHALLVSSPDPDALKLVDAYFNLFNRRHELACLLAFRLGFELGKECSALEV